MGINMSNSLTPAVLRGMYRYLSDDVSQECGGSEMNKRLQMMLDD